jgi:hypothetical protein
LYRCICLENANTVHSYTTKKARKNIKIRIYRPSIHQYSSVSKSPQQNKTKQNKTKQKKTKKNKIKQNKTKQNKTQ